ncbi:T9SS type A sorting domain-containing protein [Hymenobacter sp. HMF4947]|uniref:T9SS type A sorting domain-containing protein n=1 Tax=Hymenobacter ginkgonis TaxID=2682976 RepID=A0A7K1TDU7_9BACT|nr:T9SS type A sorting domain-containing protein [Hymenobacter ginkgonis]MVN76585.1 T9SS type A sorting domain-containing protein [Hymenobacter ginkgonis]
MKTFLLGLFAIFWSNLAIGQTLYTFNGGGTSGNWNNSNTWTTDPTGSTKVASRVPTANDNVVVTNSFVVSVTDPIATTGLKVTIQRGGVLDLTSSTATFAQLSSLSGQGTLRIGAPYFPSIAMGNNNFDDANTGTVEFYNWPAGLTVLPQPTSGQYNNLRLLNTTATAYTAQLDNTLTLTGSLTLTRTNTTVATPLVSFNLGKTASTNRTLNVQGDIAVGAGTALGVTAVTGSHTLNAGGSFSNAGTVNLHNGTTNDNQVALLNFMGATDANFACNGPTDLDILQVNKGIDSQVLLNVTGTASSTAQGNLRLNHVGNGRLLVLINGVAKFGGNIYLAKIHNGNVENSPANDPASGWWELGSPTTSPTLWVAGAQIYNDNASAFIIYGTYRISSGTLSTKTPDAMVIREDGQVLIEGGVTSVNKYRPSSTSATHRGSFIMTGGTFESLGTVARLGNDQFARFSIPYVTQAFRMTGGTLRVQNPNTNGIDGLFHIGVNPNNAIVSGGTIEVILPGSNVNGTILTTAPLWNLTIKKAAAAGTSKALLDAVAVPAAYTSGATTTAQPLTVLNNFTIDGTNPTTFDANAQNLNIQGTLTIASGSKYLPGNNTTTFSGGQDQQLVNNGAIGAAATLNTFYNWVVDKSAGTLVLAGTAKTYTVAAAGTLSLLNGVLSDNGSTINVLGNMVNSASHTSGGGTGSITLAGSTNQTVSGNDMGVFGNLNINSSVAAGGVAATFTANMSVANALTFISENILAIGANRLSLTNVGAGDAAISGVFSNKCFVQTAGNQSDLGLQKTYGGADSFVFQVGTGTKYAPATVKLALATTLAKYGQVSVSPVAARNPFVTNGTAGSLAYYWKVRSTGFGTIPSGAINMSFTMTNTDASGTLTSYVPGRYSATAVAWTPQYTDVNLVVERATTAVINFNSLNQFEGEYTAGLPAAFGTVTAYYSRASGTWATPATWSTVGFNGAAATAAPAANNPVFIGSASGKIYHNVTVAANGANSGSLVIDRGSTMDVGITTGHNFGALPDAKVGGSGRLRVSSSGATATFPGGDFGSFLQENGGTVEYYTNTTNNQDFTVPATSTTTIGATTTTLALNSYKNLSLDAGASRTITLPNLDLRVFSQLKTGTSGGTGTVLLSAAASGNLRADSLIAVQAGTLRYPNGVVRTLTANTDVRIDANAKFDVNSTGTAVANALTIGGSLTNNGVLDFNLGASRIVNLTFLGGQNANFTGTTGTLTDLYTLTLNKGVGQAATLNLDVAGSLTTPASSWLTLTNGTLRYAKTTGTLGIHNADSPYLIPSTAGLTVDAVGADVTVATGPTATTDNTTPANNTSAVSDLKLAGQLQVLQGKLSVGTATGLGNDLEYASAGAPTIRVGPAGTLYVNGQIRRTTANTNGSLRYDQTGGSVEIRGARAEVYQNNERGLFEVQGSGSIFRMSGGTLALRGTNTRPTIIADLYLRPDSTVVTAGTMVLGNTVAGNITVSVESLVPLYDMKVEAGNDATSTNTGLLTGVNPLRLQGSLTISNNFAYFNANGLGLSIDRDLLNNNASANTGLANGGFQPGTATQTTIFTGKGPVVQQITSTTTGNLTVFGGLVVNNAQTGGTLQLGRNARVIGTLTIAKGTLADNGQTLTALGDVVNTATHTSATGGSLTLAGTVNQNIDGNGKGKFGNVILNNSTGATTLADQEITGVLTLTSGVLTIGSNLLSLSNTAAGAVTGFNSTNFIRTNGIVADLGVRKSYPAGASDFTFPIGAAAKYTPVRMNVTTNSAAGTLTVQPIDLAHPSTTDPAAKELSFYWKVRSTGFSATPIVTQVFNYIDNGVGNDVNGTEANYKLGRFLNGAWVPQNGLPLVGYAVNTTANTLINTEATYFDGDYTGGEASEFGSVPTFYSRNSTAGQAGGASWDNPTTWTTNSDGSNPIVALTTYPTAANPVVIRSGHLVNSTAGDKGAATLQLLGTGILDLGASTANNFNTVTGTGTVRIGSALFPAGNYSAFVAATGGTVDYTAAVQLPARDTYNNLTFSGGNIKLLSNLDLTINGALNVAAYTTVNNPTNQSITLTSATSGATLDGTLNLNDGPLTTGAFLTSNAGSTLNLGAGAVNIGTAFTSGGTLNNGGGAVAVGTAFTNTGTYNATVGAGTLTVGTTFANNGTYNAGAGSLTVSGNFSNAANQSFIANTGNVMVGGNFSNAGSYTVADGVAGNLLRVAGDFSNLATGSFAAATSNLVLRGNFTNSGGQGFDAGQGLVQFITDDNRRLTGVTTFFNVQKVGAATLTLGTSTDVAVGNVLTLSNGLIVTGTANTLSLTNTAVQPIVGTSTSAYVAGRLAITLPAAVSIRMFPVGLGGRYRPVTLKTEDVSSQPQIILTEIFNGAPKGSIDATLSNLSANRYYRIQRLSAGTLAPVTVQLSFNTDVVDEEVHVPGNLRVAQSTGNAGPWTTAGGAGVFTPADPRGYTTSASSQTTLDSNSFFALASTNKVDNPLTGTAPLPVQLLSFTAARQGTAVRTAWATASETNSAYFVVQRSADGRTFADVQQVQAQGSSVVRHDYAALDATPLGGTSYYRLRQVDQDGTANYSPVVAVRFDGQAGAPALAAYPNPASGQGFQLLTSNLGATGGTVRVFDNVGRLVLTHVAATGAVDALIQPAQPLASGMYFVTWQTADGLKLTTKVAVE